MYIRYEHYKKKINTKKIFRDIIYVYLIAVLFVLIFNSLFLQAYKIPSNSMEPQIQENSLVLVDKFSVGAKYPFSNKRFFNGIKNIERGDIIVFMSEQYMRNNKMFRVLSTITYTLSFSLIDLQNWDKKNINTYIKRVIGLPGDRIKYEVENNQIVVYINDKPEFQVINKPYQIIEENLDNSLLLSKMTLKKEYLVKENEFYVLGDNRVSSIDSRVWEGVTFDQIIGKAILKYYPKIEVLK